MNTDNYFLVTYKNNIYNGFIYVFLLLLFWLSSFKPDFSWPSQAEINSN